MLNSIILYIFFLFGTANSECGYSSKFFQFDSTQCNIIQDSLHHGLVNPAGYVTFSELMGEIGAESQCEGPTINPNFKFTQDDFTDDDRAKGLFPLLSRYPGQCASFDESLVGSRCQAIKLTSVIGEMADSALSGAAVGIGLNFADLFSYSSLPAAIQFNSDITFVPGGGQVASVNAMASYKMSIYIFLFDDLDEQEQILSHFMWVSYAADKDLPKWMDLSGEVDQDQVNAIFDSDQVMGRDNDRHYTTFDQTCPGYESHFVQPSSDDRSFDVTVEDELHPNEGSIDFEININNQEHLGKLTMQAACISRGNELSGFGSRKHALTSLGRFVVDPCGSPELIGHYANPEDDSLAHVKCFQPAPDGESTNKCFSPISTTGTMGFCWGTVSYSRASTICASFGTYVIPTYGQITSGDCCSPGDPMTQTLPKMHGHSCHSDSFLYWTSHSRNSLVDPSHFGHGTADAPSPRLALDAPSVSSPWQTSFVLPSDRTNNHNQETGATEVWMPSHADTLHTSLQYSSTFGCDMLEVRFTYEALSGARAGEPLSYTRSWHVSSYQGFNVLIENIIGPGIVQSTNGFALNSVIDFQSGSSMPPDFKIQSENGHTFCSEDFTSTMTIGQNCAWMYDVTFDGFLKSPLTETCQMTCNYRGVSCEFAIGGLSSNGAMLLVDFNQNEFLPFSLNYVHITGESLVQLKWSCPSMERVHSGVLVSDSPGPGMQEQSSDRLVPHHVFWSKDAPLGLSYTVLPGSDCTSGTDVKFMLSHAPSSRVTVFLNDAQAGLDHCVIVFEAGTTDWRGVIVHASPSAFLKLAVALVESEDVSFNGITVDVYVTEVCVFWSQSTTCILSFDGTLLKFGTDSSPLGNLFEVKDATSQGQDIALYSDTDSDYPVQVSARFSTCGDQQKCVTGGVVIFGEDVYGAYLEGDKDVITINALNQKTSSSILLLVEEELFCTHFTSITGFRVSFCINDLKTLDIVINIPNSRGSGPCGPDSMFIAEGGLFDYPGFTRSSVLAPQWCDMRFVEQTSLDIRSRILAKSRLLPSQGFTHEIAMLDNGVQEETNCDVGPFVQSMLNSGIPDMNVRLHSMTVTTWLSSTCDSLVRSTSLPVYWILQSRNLITSYWIKHVSTFTDIGFVASEAIQVNPLFCGGQARASFKGCKCIIADNVYPDCGGDSYASVTDLQLASSCGAGDMSVLSDPSTGAIWKCYNGQCLSSKDGLRFKASEDGEYTPYCLVKITWTDSDKTQGRTLYALSATNEELTSTDGGISWQLLTPGGTPVTTDAARYNGEFQGKVGNTWTITDSQLCLSSSTLSHAKKTIVYCTNWWCNC